MRLVFMGTPAFAAPSLGELVAAGHELVAVYTQPPRPSGRGRRVTPSPVHALAESLGLPVFTPASMKAPQAIADFLSLDADAACVVAYGQILTRAVLEGTRLGCFNLHGSLLPRWRGAAPIQRAIMAGDDRTGVQIMRMSEGLDEGPVLLSETLAIRPDDTTATLADRMAVAGAALWPRALAAIERGGATETPQAGEATYARKVTSAEARIDWTRPAAEVDARIRGLSPSPGAWFMADTAGGPVRVKALMSAVALGLGADAGDAACGAPGVVVGPGLMVACGTGAVALTRVQREGRAAQAADEMLRGLALAPGGRLD